MAIGTNAAVEFFGTQDSLANTSAAVATTAFSASGDVVLWTNDDDAPEASITLVYTPASAPAGNKFIKLFAQYQAVQGAINTAPPTDLNPYKHMGDFPISAQTGQQGVTMDIPLENWKTSSIYRFFIRNGLAVSINAGWALHITPKTIGPKA